MSQLSIRSVACGLLCAGLLYYVPRAGAQDASAEVGVSTEAGGGEVAVGAEAEAGVPVVEQAPAPPAAQPAPAYEEGTGDGVRFRWGIAAAGGAEFASGFEVGMGGVEGRIGVQINDLIGVYVQPFLAFGGGAIGSIPVITGTAGASAMIDFTIADYFFVGAGGGVGVLNNPVGPHVHFRIGAYPAWGINGGSRSGLMVGLDTRLFFLSDNAGGLVVGQIMAGIGYESF